MLSCPLAEKVRQLVRNEFLRHGADSASEMRETILVQNGFFCGHRFDMDGLSAVWFVEERQVKCFSRDGAVLSVLTPDMPSRALRRAA